LKFELRLAQTEPDSSLQEMIFYNTDKTFFVHDSVYITNKEIVSTDIIDWQTQPKVHVMLNEAGRKKFAEFTKKYVGKNAAMIVGNKLMSAPRIQAPITKGVLLIVGFFSHEEAQKMASGILPKG
jgi:preprotein translocase subunit SecD